MRQILYSFGSINIYSYGLMIAIGIIAAVSIFLRGTKKIGLDEDSVLNMIIITIISGVLGGKILYIITDYETVKANGGIFNLKNFGEGFVIYGAIIAGMLSIYIYSRRKKWNIVKVLDAVVPGVAIAQGFGRIGCFLAGCCYGAETSCKLSVVFPRESLAPSGVHLHPTQVYSSIFDFLLGAFLIWYSKKENKDGRVFSMYLIIYSIGRFLVEFLRNDPRGSVGIFSTSQFISIFMFFIGLFIFKLDKFRGRKSKSE